MPRERGPFNFTKSVRDKAITAARLQDQEDVEVHHVVNVWEARKYGVSPDLVRSSINAKAMPRQEHRTEENHSGNPEGIRALLELQPRLFSNDETNSEQF